MSLSSSITRAVWYASASSVETGTIFNCRANAMPCNRWRPDRSLEPGGTLVTVHWDHPVPEHHRTGSQLAGPLSSLSGLAQLTEVRDSDFRLQVFARTAAGGPAPLSPAAEEGLL